MNISTFGKFLQIGLAALSAVSPLEAEFASGSHLQAISDTIQVAAQLASAATTDTKVQGEIAAAAAVVPSVLTTIANLIASFKAPAAPAA